MLENSSRGSAFRGREFIMNTRSQYRLTDPIRSKQRTDQDLKSYLIASSMLSILSMVMTPKTKFQQFQNHLHTKT